MVFGNGRERSDEEQKIPPKNFRERQLVSWHLSGAGWYVLEQWGVQWSIHRRFIAQLNLFALRSLSCCLPVLPFPSRGAVVGNHACRLVTGKT